MRRMVVALIGCALCATAAAQPAASVDDASAAKASSDKSKQEIVKSTTESQTKQRSGAGYHGPKPTAEAKKLSDEEKQQVMSGVAKSAKDQYRPSAPPSAAANKNASKAKRPRMSDPDMQETIKKQQRS